MKKLAILSLVLAAGAAMAAEPGSYDPMITTMNVGARTAVQAQVSPPTATQTGEVGPFSSGSTASMPRDTAAVRAEGRWASRAYQTFGEVGAV